MSHHGRTVWPTTRAGWVLTVAAAAGVIGIIAGMEVNPPAVVGGLMCAISAAGLVVGRRQTLRELAAVGIALGLGLLRGGAAAPPAGTIDLAPARGAVVVDGTVRSVTLESGGATTAVAVDSVGSASGPMPARGTVVGYTSGNVDWEVGDRVEVTATGLHAAGSGSGGSRSIIAARAAITRTAGAGPLADLVAAARQRLDGAVTESLPEPDASLVLGIGFGIHRRLSPSLRGSLQDSGLIHVVAVSGLKVVLLVTMIGSLLHRIPIRVGPRGLLTAAVIGAYVLLSGAGAAAVRGAVMAGVAMWVRWTGERRLCSLTLLAVVATTMIGVEPQLDRDLGFQLSFLGTLGILVAADRIGRLLPGPAVMRESLAATVSAQLFTAPITAITFHSLSLVAPIANALALPALPAVVAASALGAVAAVLNPLAGSVLLHLAGWGVRWFAVIAGLSASLPGAAVRLDGSVGSAVLAAGGAAALAAAGGVAVRSLAVWIEHRRATARRIISAILCMVAVGGAAVGALVSGQRPDVIVLDVGTGIAILVEVPDQGVAVIDMGAGTRMLSDALARVGGPLSRRIDFLLVASPPTAAASQSATLDVDVRIVRAVEPVTSADHALLDGLAHRGADVASVPSGTVVWGSFRAAIVTSPAGTGQRAVGLHIDVGAVTVAAVSSTGVAAQEDLATGLGRAELLVVAPTDLVAGVLLDSVRPRDLVVAGSARGAATHIEATARTAVDGDVRFGLSASGLERRG